MSLKEELEQRRREDEKWRAAKKPARLLDMHDRQRFLSLFDDEDPLARANQTMRSVWWNGTPEVPTHLVPLLAHLGAHPQTYERRDL